MRTLEHHGHRLRFVDRGSGTPVVFLHNGGVSHRLWDHQIRFFAGTHRVIAPDLLGYGESDRPHVLYTAAGYRAQVERLADGLDLGAFHLAGCCLGGGVALQYALRHPGRVRSLTLITVATPRTIGAGILGPFERLSRRGRRVRGAIARALETPPGRLLMSRAMYRYQCGAAVLEDAGFRDHVRRLYWREGQWRVFSNTDYGGFADLDRLDGGDRLPPTLLMWGGRNRILPAVAGRELERRLRPARSEFWEDCGYMLMRERPAETNRVLADLFARCESGRSARDPVAAR